VETDSVKDDAGITTTRAIYDAKTLVLQSATSHCDCGGAPFDATVVHGTGSTYTIEAKTGGTTSKDDKSEVHVPDGDLIVMGNELLVPMMVSRLHVEEVVSVSYGPNELIPEQVASEQGDRPSGIPGSDVAVSIRPPRDRNNHVTRFLWYNPCTFRVDGIDVSTMSIED
jgi:hypothetical protein